MAFSKKKGLPVRTGTSLCLPNRVSEHLRRATPWENLSLSSKNFLPLGPQEAGFLCICCFNRSFSGQGDNSVGKVHLQSKHWRVSNTGKSQ